MLWVNPEVSSDEGGTSRIDPLLRPQGEPFTDSLGFASARTRFPGSPCVWRGRSSPPGGNGPWSHPYRCLDARDFKVNWGGRVGDLAL